MAVRDSDLYGLSFVGPPAEHLQPFMHLRRAWWVHPSKGGKTTACSSHTFGFVRKYAVGGFSPPSAAMQRLRPSENLTRDAEGPSGPASGFPRPVQAGWGSGYHHLDVDSIWGFGPATRRYEGESSCVILSRTNK